MKYRFDPKQPSFDFTERPRARRTDPQTSKDAAARIKPGRRIQVLEAFANTKDATTMEIAETMGLQRDTVSPHVKPLIAAKHLELLRHTRTNPATGNQCQVYAVTEAGKYFLNNWRKRND